MNNGVSCPRFQSPHRPAFQSKQTVPKIYSVSLFYRWYASSSPHRPTFQPKQTIPNICCVSLFYRRYARSWLTSDYYMSWVGSYTEDPWMVTCGLMYIQSHLHEYMLLYVPDIWLQFRTNNSKANVLDLKKDNSFIYGHHYNWNPMYTPPQFSLQRNLPLFPKTISPGASGAMCVTMVLPIFS